MSIEVKNVLISDPLDKSAIDILSKANINVQVNTGLSPQQLIEEIKNYDALFVRSGTQVTADVINAASNLKFIGRAGVGVDNIDVNAATSKGVIVVNSPGGNTLAAAELTCGMLIAVSRHIALSSTKLKAGIWDRKSFMGTELYGKTLGVIGLGRIGREVATRMQSFGMRTIGFDPIVSKEESAKYNIEQMSLEEMYPQVDYITLHVPLIKQTKNMINLEVLQKCKKGVRVVNCARGGIINEEEAIIAMDQGLCDGIAVDVYEQEPPTNRKFVEHEKVLCTPHLGASTKEAQVRVAVEVAEQLVCITKGQSVWGCVNPATLPK